MIWFANKMCSSVSQVFRATHSILIPACMTTHPHGMHWIGEFAVWHFPAWNKTKPPEIPSTVSYKFKFWKRQLLSFVLHALITLCRYENISSVAWYSTTRVCYKKCAHSLPLLQKLRPSCHHSALRNIQIMAKWFLNVKVQ